MKITPHRGASTEGELEVLPPERPSSYGHGVQQKAVVWLIQHFMDNLLRVPGTKRARIGLTPFLELIPGIGDGAAVLVSAYTIVEGARQRVPKIVLTRMALNVLLNGLIGNIPVVGEAFSFWFKPSYRNYLLLQKHGASSAPGAIRSRATTRDWVFVIGLLAVLFIVAAALIVTSLYVVWHLLTWVVNPR